MRYLNKFFFVGLLAGIALTLAIIDAGGYYFQRRRLSDLMVNRKALGIGRFKFSYAKSSERFPHPWFPSVGQRVGLNSYATWSLRDSRRAPRDASRFSGQSSFPDILGDLVWTVC